MYTICSPYHKSNGYVAFAASSESASEHSPAHRRGAAPQNDGAEPLSEPLPRCRTGAVSAKSSLHYLQQRCESRDSAAQHVLLRAHVHYRHVTIRMSRVQCPLLEPLFRCLLIFTMIYVITGLIDVRISLTVT